MNIVRTMQVPLDDRWLMTRCSADILALMSALYSDTDPRIEQMQIELGRQASPTRKMHMLAQLNASARILALAGLRSRYTG